MENNRKPYIENCKMSKRKSLKGLRAKEKKLVATVATYFEKARVFNDPIHGNIELHPLCVKIVDTPQFQRLRFIKQLGGAYFVYPGAAHNRFEHSIGVCHLAGRLVRALRDQKSEALKDVDITPVDELCVEIAALCHDLGHGPFSHLFDRKIIPKLRKDKEWEHENGSVDMLRYMLKENDGKLEKEFEKENITLLDRKFIEELIVGPDGTSSKKIHLIKEYADRSSVKISKAWESEGYMSYVFRYSVRQYNKE